MPKVICLDIDGCLANFNLSYGRLLVRVGGDRLPANWDTNPDFPTTWGWEHAAGYPPEVVEEVWTKNILKEGSKFWLNLEPLEGTREVLFTLNRLAKDGVIDLYFLTHRMGHKAKLQTEAWLYEHGIDYPTVILGGDKVPYLRELKANFFIDDKPTTIVDVARASVEERWENFNLYVKDAPYNRDVILDSYGGADREASVRAALQAAGVWD